MPRGWRKALRDCKAVGRKYWAGGSTYKFCRCSSCTRQRQRAKHGEVAEFGKHWAEQSKNFDYVQYVQRQGVKKQDCGYTKADHVRDRRSLRDDVRRELLASASSEPCDGDGMCEAAWCCSECKETCVWGGVHCEAAASNLCDGDPRGGDRLVGWRPPPTTCINYTMPQSASDLDTLAVAVAEAMRSDPRPMADRVEPPPRQTSEHGLWAGRVSGALRALVDRWGAAEQERYRRLWRDQHDIMMEQWRIRQRQALRARQKELREEPSCKNACSTAREHYERGVWLKPAHVSSADETEVDVYGGNATLSEFLAAFGFIDDEGTSEQDGWAARSSSQSDWEELDAEAMEYSPPDFDHTKIPRQEKEQRQKIQERFVVRMMLPMSVRCLTCGEYMYKGKKFNSRKENVEGPEGDYLGIQIFRFYFKCTSCSAEFTVKTDPKNMDYVMEGGAKANFELWKEEAKEKESIAAEREKDEKYDTMKQLENKTEESKRAMDILESDWEKLDPEPIEQHVEAEGFVIID